MNEHNADRVMSPSDVAGLVEELEKARQEARENHEQYLRVLADQDNYRKRLHKVFQDRLEQQYAGLLRNLLAVMDDLERALAYGSEGDPLTSGVKLTYDQLLKVLRQEGVEPIQAQGQPFDPELHEAVEVIPGDGGDGTDLVDAELVTGYLYKERLLRPASVRVRKGS